MPPKKKKTKGRPPKYVLDDEGREVVGLSYNPTNNMYYITSSSPRQYIKVGNQIRQDRRKKEAIRLFEEWKKHNNRSFAEIDAESELLKKARHLIEEGFYDDLVENRARDLIKNDVYIQEYIIQKAFQYLNGEIIHPPAYSLKCYRDEKWKIQQKIDMKIEDKANSIAERNIRYGYEKLICKRVHDIINQNPIHAAKLIGAPCLVFTEDFKSMPLSWDMSWKIFSEYKDTDTYLYDHLAYYYVQVIMSMLLSGYKLKDIHLKMFREAFENTSKTNTILSEFDISKMSNFRKEYFNIPAMDRIEILKDVFMTIENIGFLQASHILKLISKLSKNI